MDINTAQTIFPLILSLDVGGRPIRWLHWHDAACLCVRDQIVWSAGENTITIHGGINRASHLQSLLRINSIIAVRGSLAQHFDSLVPTLNNRELFRRDNNLCLYCGKHFSQANLTRDHVIPIAQGGEDTWENVVSACQVCNQRKDCRKPHEAKMPLLAIPFTPNRAEYLILANRHILTDQMAFLSAYKPRKRLRQ